MYEIRYANVSDAKDLAYIHATTWKKAYKGILPKEVLENITVEKREKYFEKVLADKSEKNALIFKDKRAVGFICIGKCRDNDKNNDYGEVWGIYLLQNYWHKGIGSILINWGITELKKRKYKKVSLWVLEENISARKFYEKNGFRYDGTINEINIGKKLRECRYEKTLI